MKTGEFRRVGWAATARVIDLAAFTRLRAGGAGAKLLAQGLGCSISGATHLMRGDHWQQTPDSVRVFNAQRGGNVDPETGQPTDEDMKKFGGPRTRGRLTEGTEGRELVDHVQASGVEPKAVGEAVRRLQALMGGAPDAMSGKVDAAYIEEQVGEKLRLFFANLDAVAISGLAGKDLVAGLKTLIEIRALMRGEPTQIIRTEHRLKLDDLMGKVVSEARRRGVKIVDVEAKLIEGNA